MLRLEAAEAVELMLLLLSMASRFDGNLRKSRSCLGIWGILRGDFEIEESEFGDF